jgi:hypothetical protein
LVTDNEIEPPITGGGLNTNQQETKMSEILIQRQSTWGRAKSVEDALELAKESALAYCPGRRVEVFPEDKKVDTTYYWPNSSRVCREWWAPLDPFVERVYTVTLPYRCK